MNSRSFWLFPSALLLLVAASNASKMTVPVYDPSGNMIRPEGYRKWVFVGSSLGLRYEGEGGNDQGPGSFHNVYIQPEAYETFLESGVFPEKTILAMETYSAGTREPKSGLTSGFYGDRFTGLSAAVKDKERFPEGWGYVSFMRDGSRFADSAAPFAKEQCYDCHREHAATDNVFTQFYPVLRR
ncbi:MAG: cytochrome P460 family protein [Vicinamibacteria bacterium]